MDVSLSAAVDAFRQQGFVRVSGAFDAQTCGACVAAIEDELRQRSVNPTAPDTWIHPVVRLNTPWGPAFAKAGTSPALWALYDALLGEGNWTRLPGVGGTVPVRFRSESDPGDAGWHIDGSYEIEGRYFANIHSRSRALLALFLFTNVTERDAPTEIIIGSHQDVPPILSRYGDDGVFFGEVVPQLPGSTFERPRAFATGMAGDVYVCHPFIVHRATWPHRGQRPRIVAQPGIGHSSPFELLPGRPRCLVEEMILENLPVY